MGLFSSSRVRRLRRGGLRPEIERSKAKAVLSEYYHEWFATNGSEPDASMRSIMTACVSEETRAKQSRHFVNASLDTHHLIDLTDSLSRMQATQESPQGEQETPSSPDSKGSHAMTDSPTSIVYQASDRNTGQSPLNADDHTLALLPWRPQKQESPASVHPERAVPAPMTYLESAYIEEELEFNNGKGQSTQFYSDDLMSFFGHGNTKTSGKLRNRLQLLAARQLPL